MPVTLDYATLVLARRKLVESMQKLNPMQAAQAQAGVQYSVDVLSDMLAELGEKKGDVKE